MPDTLADNRGTLVLRGYLALLLGLGALLWPGPALLSLVILFGAYAVVDGVLAILAGDRSTAGPRWLSTVEGAIGLLAGIVVLVWPGITAGVLTYVVAFWASFAGIARMASAMVPGQKIEGGWVLILNGLLSILFGIVLALLPDVGLDSLAWLVGTYAIVLGVSLLVRAFRV